MRERVLHIPGSSLGSRPASRAAGAVRAHAGVQTPVADTTSHVQLVRASVATGHTVAVVRSLQRQFGNAYTTDVVSSALSGERETVPRAVESRILAARGGGQPLEPELRRQMEARFQYDFGGVRVHTDPAANEASQAVQARAFTLGRDLFFDRGQFNTRSGAGRTLLAHELAHVVQNDGRPVQTPLTLSTPGEPAEREAEVAARESDAMVSEPAPSNVVHLKCSCETHDPSEECEECRQRRQTTGVARAASSKIQRDKVASPYPLIEPEQITDVYWAEIMAEKWEDVATPLVLALYTHPRPFYYIDRAIDEIGSAHEDELAAAFVKRLTEPQLDRMATSSAGRATLTRLYEAMITGDVSSFQREQADKILVARLRHMSPEDYIRATKQNAQGRPIRIFPVRFMSLTPWKQEAPLDAKLETGEDKKLRIRVTYPVRVESDRMFAAEWKTIPLVFSGGEVLSPNEIVGIKDYESGGGQTVFLPALALLDYANRASRSTLGKIADVAMFAATFGTSGAVAGAGRLGKVLLWADRVADVIQVASIFVNENRDWIVETFPRSGPALIRAVEVANSAAAIYGVGRLAGAGFTIVRDLRQASRAAREEAKNLGKQLSEQESTILRQLDDKTDSLIRDVEAEEAKKAQAIGGKTQEPAPVAERPAAAKKKVEPEAPRQPAKRGAPVDELEATAKRTGIPTLKDEVAELRTKSVAPDAVGEPANANFDAEMDAGGHRFERQKRTRTWCRHSDGTCELNLGKQLNDDTDRALRKKRRRKLEGQAEREAAQAEKEAKAAAKAAQKQQINEAKKKVQQQIEAKRDTQLAIYQDIEEATKSGQRRMSDTERAVVTKEKDELAREARQTIAEKTGLQKRLEDLEISPYERARAYSYSDDAAREVVARGGGLDEMSGKVLREPSIDHLVPVDDIVLMKGYTELPWAKQQLVLSRTDNLRLMEKGANSSKGAKRWSKWPEGRRIYGDKVWRAMVTEEGRMRRLIEEQIAGLLKGRSS